MLSNAKHLLSRLLGGMIVVALAIPLLLIGKDRITVVSQSSLTDAIVVKCTYRNYSRKGSRVYKSSYTPVALSVEGDRATGTLYLTNKSWCARMIGTSVPMFVHHSDPKQNRIGSFLQFWMFPFIAFAFLALFLLPNKAWYKSVVVTGVLILSGYLICMEFNILNLNNPETNLTSDSGKFDACVNKAMREQGVNERNELKRLSCYPLPDIELLYDFNALEDVFIRTDKLITIDQIPDLPALRKLSLRSPNLQSLDGLEKFTKLSTLWLSEVRFPSINSIPQFSELKELKILFNPDLTSLDGIEKYRSLEQIEAERNSISDITSLASLENLKVVQLFYEPVSDLSALSNLDELEVARFRSLKTHDFSPLYNKPNMRHPGATGPDIPCDEMQRWMNTLEPMRRKFMWLPKHCKFLKEQL